MERKHRQKRADTVTALPSRCVSLSRQATAVRGSYLQASYCATSFLAALSPRACGLPTGALTFLCGLEPKGTIALLSGHSRCSPCPSSVFFRFLLQHSRTPLPPFSPSAPARPVQSPGAHILDRAPLWQPKTFPLAAAVR